MNIAIIGTRGIPANYGGFETCVEEISTGLVKLGYDITVYCRKGISKNDSKFFNGVKLIHLPHLENKNLGTLTHSFLAFLHACFQQFDLILVFNVGLAPFCLLPRLFGMKILLNVDGLEWKRKKWGFLARKYFLFCERIAPYCVNEIITDSKAVQQYFLDKYKTPSVYIAYGAHTNGRLDMRILEKYCLKKDGYFLIASRLEPENNADLIIKAFEKVNTNKKLVIAGGANYDSEFVRKLKMTRDKRIIFLGPVYEPGHIETLHMGCFAYIHGNEVGGTNPALLKAMGYGNRILSYDVEYNRETAGNTALYFNNPVELKNHMSYLLSNPLKYRNNNKKGIDRIRDFYDWNSIILRYERLFRIVSSNFK